VGIASCYNGLAFFIVVTIMSHKLDEILEVWPAEDRMPSVLEVVWNLDVGFFRDQ
jgi:hypothetical protein